MKSIEERAGESLQGFMDAEKLLGTNLRTAKGAQLIAAKAAEIDLDKDLGRYGEWKETYPSIEWCHADARILRNIRLDAAEVRYLSLNTNTVSHSAMIASVKSYYLCIFLAMLNLAQFPFVWWLLTQSS